MIENHFPFQRLQKTIPGLAGQEDIIQAINQGNIQLFNQCIERGDDVQSENTKGMSPEKYLKALIQKPSCLNPNKKAHKEMRQAILLHQVFRHGDLTSLFGNQSES